MKVKELIAKLKANKLNFKVKYNPQQTALYYSEEKRGNKFLEIHADKNENVTIVKFYQHAILPTSIVSNTEDSGDDDNRINRQLKYDNNDEAIISVAIASYSKVREEKLLEEKNNLNL